jgi:inosine/xanthosine triphosphate pyrophosphatase family protein
MPSKHLITYVTSSPFKIEENELLMKTATFPDGVAVGSLFEFRIRQVPIKEVLEVDLATLVMAEVTKAYSEIRVPCIVEHAGLVFEEYVDASYPGGLTKPMWNALGSRFVEETHSDGRRAIARAVVAFCDGMSVKTFVGETRGSISGIPRGSKPFYWDPVFVPDNPDGTAGDKTYAEIVDDPAKGLPYKVSLLSQSTKAMMNFLTYMRDAPPSPLWSPVA